MVIPDVLGIGKVIPVKKGKFGISTLNVWQDISKNIWSGFLDRDL